METLHTVGEVAALLRVSTMTVYRLIRTGELAAVRIGRNYRVNHRDLTGYLDAQSVTPEPTEVADQ